MQNVFGKEVEKSRKYNNPGSPGVGIVQAGKNE